MSNEALPDVDVLIPTYRRPVPLAVMLTSLMAQTYRRLRVVVSDQTERDTSLTHPRVQDVVRSMRARGMLVELHRHVPRRGLAEHRAALLACSGARYVLFLDDDVWLEPGTVGRLHEAIVTLRCGLVGAAVQGLSYLDDVRPAELAPFERWTGRPEPERIEPGTPGWERWTLHNAANPVHLARQHLRPGERWLPYKIAWVGGCVLYDRRVLEACGGFDFWTDLPESHCGEDVLAQQRVLAAAGGAGILPSGAYHLESPTTMPDRTVQARDVVGAAGRVS